MQKSKELINEMPFDPSQSFLVHVHMIQTLMSRIANKSLLDNGVDVKAEQMPVLMYLWIKPKVSQQEISDGIDRDKSSVSRTVSNLVKKGMARLKEDKNDSRKKLVELTAKGRRAAEAIDVIRKDIDDNLTERLKHANKADIIKAIAILGEAMSALHIESNS